MREGAGSKIGHIEKLNCDAEQIELWPAPLGAQIACGLSELSEWVVMVRSFHPSSISHWVWTAWEERAPE